MRYQAELGKKTMHNYEGNTLFINGIFYADDYNEVVRKYRREMDGFDHYMIKKGDLITADILNDLSNGVRNYASQNGYSIGNTPRVLVAGVDLIPKMEWGEAIWNDQPVIELTSGQYNYVIPKGCRKMKMEWLIAGGGGGGGGEEGGGGKSGGGGGSGGYQQNIVHDVMPNQKVFLQIGGGGIGNYDSGASGGDSFVRIDETEILRVTGGGGGNTPYAGGGILDTAGGKGGSPNGTDGGHGVDNATEDDHLGGAGGSTPLGKGGTPDWADKAQSGSGYGAGGAGGCTRDRQSPHSWQGGDGSTGYIKFQFTR